MKIAKPAHIKGCEAEMLKAARDHLDLAAITELIRNALDESCIGFASEHLTVSDGRIAYRFDLAVSLRMNVTIDREGNLIGSESSFSREAHPPHDLKPPPGKPLQEILRENRLFWQAMAENA